MARELSYSKQSEVEIFEESNKKKYRRKGKLSAKLIAEFMVKLKLN